jgi:hypothetical protein
MKTKHQNTATSLINKLTKITDNITNDDYSNAKQDLEVCSKQLAIFAKEVGSTSPLFKKIDILKDKISLEIEGHERLSQYV